MNDSYPIFNQISQIIRRLHLRLTPRSKSSSLKSQHEALRNLLDMNLDVGEWEHMEDEIIRGAIGDELISCLLVV